VNVSGTQEIYGRKGWRVELRRGTVFRNMRIRNKALLIFIIAGLIPLILTNAFAYVQAESNIRSTIERQDLRFAQATGDHLVSLFSNLKAVDGSLALDQTVFGAFDVRAGDVGTGAWFTIAYPELDLLLPEVTRQFGGLALIFLTDTSGICIYATGNKTIKSVLEGYDLTSNVAIGDAIGSALAGEQAWSQSTPFDPLKTNVLILSTPVHAAGRIGNVVGTVNILVDQENLDALVLDNIDILGQTADTYCIAADGTLLTDMKHGEYSVGSALRVKLDDETVRELAGPIREDQWNFSKLIQYQDGSGVTVLAYLNVVHFGTIPVGLITRVDADEAFAQVTQLRNVLVIAVACVACLGSIISIRIARMLSNPTNKLLDVVKEMASGNTALKPEVEGRDEIGSLAVGIGEVVRNHEKLIQTILDAEKKLAQNERLAAVGELALMVGHDLRNPLQSIVTALHILKNNSSRTGDEKSKEVLEIIHESVMYADKVVRDLSEYSKELHLDRAQTQTSSIIHSTISSAKIPSNVSVNLPPNSYSVNVDPVAMQRVFANLVNNAIDAMPKGGTLTIRSAKSNGSVETHISDTGIGVPKEIMENIGKPLKTTKAKGMGLGLAIAKRITEAHGGRLSVQSTSGIGSTFTVSLPENDNLGEKGNNGG
jgi:methyl-accepting chemotaxis protein